MFWKKKSEPASIAEWLPQQMQSDERFAVDLELLNETLRTVTSCKETYLAEGLKDEFELVQQCGAMFMLHCSRLRLARSLEDIPAILGQIRPTAMSLMSACDKVTSATEIDGLRTLMNGLVQVVGNVTVSAETEYRV